MPNIQTYDKITVINNPQNMTLDHVFCSNCIQYESGHSSFEKIGRDYEHESVQYTKVSFNHRNHAFHINKYMKCRYFLDSTNRSSGKLTFKLTFVTPDKWDDPCESFFYNSNIVINNKQCNLACYSTTLESTENEESAWKRGENNSIVSPGDKTIRVSFDFMTLCKALNNYAKDKDIRFYLSMCDYSESRDFFTNKKNTTFIINEETDYIQLMSKKRKAFSYENEMRIFAVGDGVNVKDGLFQVELDIPNAQIKSLIPKVTLPPYPVIPREDPFATAYANIQDMSNFPLRAAIKKQHKDIGIQQCRLYQTGESNNKNLIHVLSKTFQI